MDSPHLCRIVKLPHHTPTKRGEPMDTIRQTLLFSFDELYEMQLKFRLELILNEITIPVQFSNLLKVSDEQVPKGYSPLSMLYVVIAMCIEGFPTASSLSEDLRAICTQVCLWS